MQHKITIGIRTYNVQNYIEECLTSVYNQSIKDDLKIVLVDDCSTDNTLNVINKWINEHVDFQIEVHTNSKNQGAGVMLMQLQEYIKDSEYVIILDSDDFYTKTDCMEYMYNFIKKHDFDFVKFSKHIDYYHVKNLMKYDLYKQIKFNPFRFAEDHYDNWLRNVTNNYVLHEYDFYYYRNNSSSLVRNNNLIKPIVSVFDDIYYHNIPESVCKLDYIIPDSEEQDIYNEMKQISYVIKPAVLVLSKNTDLSEFINHYTNLGFDQIFVLDNNEKPIKYDNVTVIPYNNIQLFDWVEFQSTAYDYALRLIKQTDCNYLLVVDDDEYLDLKTYSNIKDFIKSEMILKGHFNCDFIWETYDDNDIIYEKDVKDTIQNTYTRKLTHGKFSDVCHIDWTKALFRIFPETSFHETANPGHHPNLNYKENVVNSKIAVLKHYRTQCLETFIKSKILQKNFRKGHFGSFGLLNGYFCINKCSFEKLEAFKQLFSKYNIELPQEEFDKYYNQVVNQYKPNIIIPINSSEDLKLIKNLNIPKEYKIIVVSVVDVDSDEYDIVRRGSNIYDTLTYIIKTSSCAFMGIVFPNSLIYDSKFEKQLNYLQDHPNVDLVTCNCKYNSELNTKPIISTVLFRTESLQKLDILFEHYYDTYDKFFINCNDLVIHNIEEILQEETFNDKPCAYDIHNLTTQNVLNKDITVIIPFQNEGYEVRKTVESIRATTKGVPIILIDDQSTDGYNYKAIADKYNCRLVRNKFNLGVSEARNLGVSLCETPYFVLLDGHMRFYDLDWDEMLVNYLNKEPNAIYCSNGATIYKTGDYFYSSEHKFPAATLGGHLDFHAFNEFNVVWSFKALDKNSDITRIPAVFGACYASSVKHWNHIGGLSGLVKYGYDEALMSVKTWLTGGKCYLIKNFYVGHLYRTTAPYYVDNIHMKANQIFLSYLFDYEITPIDAVQYNKACRLLDFDKINNIKEQFNKIKVHSFDYFLNLNKLLC